MGTWCSDSRREVQRFLKIIDAVNYPEDNLTINNVNSSKVGLRDEVAGLEIDFIETPEIDLIEIINSPN